MLHEDLEPDDFNSTDIELDYVDLDIIPYSKQNLTTNLIDQEWTPYHIKTWEWYITYPFYQIKKLIQKLIKRLKHSK
jgi:hypothetical protein